MRDEIMESSEDDFVRSLSHCVNWQARGGKSGAVFYATEGEFSRLIFPFDHLLWYNLTRHLFSRGFFSKATFNKSMISQQD